MLSRQKHPIELTGGLEAARLKPWHVEELKKLHVKQMFFAYDTPEDLEPLHAAGKMLISGGFTVRSHALRCFVLCGFKDDTIKVATKRMIETIEAGFTPMAMLWRSDDGWRNPDFIGSKFQKLWARPAIIHHGENKKNVTQTSI